MEGTYLANPDLSDLCIQLYTSYTRAMRCFAVPVTIVDCRLSVISSCIRIIRFTSTVRSGISYLAIVLCHKDRKLWEWFKHAMESKIQSPTTYL